MNIEGSENIREIFSIFHDGTIAHVTKDGSDLLLEVAIQYLAERINLSFGKFFVLLANVRDLRFMTWPSDLKSEPAVITDISIIFKPELEILEGNIKDGAIQVVCIQSSPDFNYRGGELYLQAEFAQVSDEAGSYYTIDELGSLSQGYWDDLSNKS